MKNDAQKNCKDKSFFYDNSVSEMLWKKIFLKELREKMGLNC